MQYVTRAGKMSRNAHGLIMSYRQNKMRILVQFEVFTKMSSSSPLLVIPMLQIVIKLLKWSLFGRLLRGLLDDCCCFLTQVTCSSIVAKHSIPALWIFTSSPNQSNMIFRPMLMKTKRSRWLTLAKRVHKPLRERAFSL